MFKPATRKNAKVRAVLHGPSGSGKTWTALSLATHLVGPGGKIAVADTERGSASLYSGPDQFRFDVVEIEPPYNPSKVPEVIAGAAAGGYGALIIDSVTHFWVGAGGILEGVDAEAKRVAAVTKGRVDTHAAWKKGDEWYRKLIVDPLLGAPMHVFVTLRDKQETAKQEENGRMKIVKLGLAPQMREGFEYELGIEMIMDMNNTMVIGKSRCPAMPPGTVFQKPGKDVATILADWCNAGAPTAEPAVNG